MPALNSTIGIHPNLLRLLPRDCLCKSIQSGSSDWGTCFVQSELFGTWETWMQEECLFSQSCQCSGQVQGCHLSPGGTGGPAPEPMVPGQQSGRRTPSVKKHPKWMGVPPYITVTPLSWPLMDTRILCSYQVTLSFSQGPTVFSCCPYAKKLVSWRFRKFLSGEEEVTLHWVYASTQETWTNIGFRSKAGVNSPLVNLPGLSAVWREEGLMDLRNIYLSTTLVK